MTGTPGEPVSGIARGIQLVWFKRDLRTADHLPLLEASRRGPCLCLYLYEPAVVEAADFDPSHLVFINESLAELDTALRAMGAQLTLRRGEAVEVLDALHRELGIDTLWSHQETGNAVTYARDRAVAHWARAHGVGWTQVPGHGVVRRLPTRDGWSRRWTEHMRAPVAPRPGRIDGVPGVDPGALLDGAALGLGDSARTQVQRGGESAALDTLSSFLRERGVGYRGDMSSPVTAWTGCSRLSPFLAWGNVSMRQVFQRTERRREDLRRARGAGRDVDPRWAGSLKAFSERLRWHCHFIQKLEDQPSIEFENMSRAYDGLRENDFDEARFRAWANGQTGFPMVDACMRALHESGWINFRMRAMLVSFASYHLWLHWRPTALHLSRLFLDYEPGIHYSQVQMQSGVTGINALRIYSPAKQVLDQDPKGVFIRRYCPELAQVPDEHLAEPHRMSAEAQRRAGCVLDRDYPAPVVDHVRAVREARARIFAVRGSSAARQEAEQVYRRHGSRRGARSSSRRASGTAR